MTAAPTGLPTGDLDLDARPPWMGWRRDKGGVLRGSPARDLSQLVRALPAPAAAPAPPAVPLDLSAFSVEEMHAADLAHSRARRGAGPELTAREDAARRAFQSLRERGLLPPKPRPRPALDVILDLVGVGMDLPGIAAVRGSSPKRVLAILRDAGREDVVAGLKALPGRPRASVEAAPQPGG